MQNSNQVDQGGNIDWGNTSEDYAIHRPGPPKSFYNKLAALGVGLENQAILDLGTGTGLLARQFAKQGCIVTGTDISIGQIDMAKQLAQKENLEIDFYTMPSEQLDFPEITFDVIIANQCFLYFDKTKTIPLIKKLLKPNGVFVTSHFSWMPSLSPIAKASEDLILEHNPTWTGHSYKGIVEPIHDDCINDFYLTGFFAYDEGIPFTQESWRGRIRASRGISASLDKNKVIEFDNAHKNLLNKIAPKEFKIMHRIDAHVMRPLG